MKVYINGEKFAEFKNFMWRIGDTYLLRIIGIDLVSTEKIKLEVVPFYLPVFQVSARGGQLIFQIILNQKTVLTFLFQAHYPYIHIGKYETEIKYEE